MASILLLLLLLSDSTVFEDPWLPQVSFLVLTMIRDRGSETTFRF